MGVGSGARSGSSDPRGAPHYAPPGGRNPRLRRADGGSRRLRTRRGAHRQGARRRRRRARRRLPAAGARARRRRRDAAPDLRADAAGHRPRPRRDHARDRVGEPAPLLAAGQRDPRRRPAPRRPGPHRGHRRGRDRRRRRDGAHPHPGLGGRAARRPGPPHRPDPAPRGAGDPLARGDRALAHRPAGHRRPARGVGDDACRRCRQHADGAAHEAAPRGRRRAGRRAARGRVRGAVGDRPARAPDPPQPGTGRGRAGGHGARRRGGPPRRAARHASRPSCWS